MKYNRVLVVAGSDSGAGAGIQADIKSVAANGGYATTAITAITAQNTVGVESIFPLPVDVVEAQMRAVLSDIGCDSVKIGMLHSAEIISRVASTLAEFHVKNIVVDPVMVATSGDNLLERSSVAALVSELIPMSAIITPNIPETEVLLGRELSGIDDMVVAAKELSLGGRISVLVKGGHMECGDDVCDVLFDATTSEVKRFVSKRVYSQNTHGTGCTLSSAIAAHLAGGKSVYDSVECAINYISKAIASGVEYKLGLGHGPVNHFCR